MSHKFNPFSSDLAMSNNVNSKKIYVTYNEKKNQLRVPYKIRKMLTDKNWSDGATHKNA